MPVRSNLYQRLVLEIHRQLGASWTVSESRELVDFVTGDKREVDIVAESKVGGYPIFLCIEVCDRNRPADQPYLEQLAMEHDHLPGKLVVWSRAGFSRPARKFAETQGIETVTPGTCVDAHWASISQQLAKVQFMRPKFEPPVIDVNFEDGTCARWSAEPGTLFHRASTGRSIPVDAIVNQIVTCQSTINTLLDHAPEGVTEFHVEFQYPDSCDVIRPDGKMGKLKRLLIGIKTQCEVSSFIDSKSALHRGIFTTLAEARLSDGTLQVVVRESEDGSVSSVGRLVKALAK